MARDLFEVVENQQAFAAPGDDSRQVRQRILPACLDRETTGNCVCDAVDRTRARQIAEPRTPGKPGELCPSESLGKARLADAARAHDRNYTRPRAERGQHFL